MAVKNIKLEVRLLYHIVVYNLRQLTFKTSLSENGLIGDED